MTTRGRPFEKGQSGNPAGRRPGTRRAATTALEAILEGDASDIVRKATELAKAGDPVALRLCLDRLVPPRRDRALSFALPPIETPADLTKATGALLAAVAAGELIPAEATELSKLVEAHMAAVKAVDFDARLRAIEERNPSGGP